MAFAAAATAAAVGCAAPARSLRSRSGCSSSCRYQRGSRREWSGAPPQLLQLSLEAILLRLKLVYLPIRHLLLLLSPSLRRIFDLEELPPSPPSASLLLLLLPRCGQRNVSQMLWR